MFGCFKIDSTSTCVVYHVILRNGVTNLFLAHNDVRITRIVSVSEACLISGCFSLDVLQFVQRYLFDDHQLLLLLCPPATQEHLAREIELIPNGAHHNNQRRISIAAQKTRSKCTKKTGFVEKLAHPKAPCPITRIFSYLSIPQRTAVVWGR